ncbi:Shedu immune nuclease family protein [Agrobacterium sp. DE0009]|uniref:Shedu immune nuclease family protein n=1 Tax=Agrobacterium sp. DE0009 TaxID=2587505 RepID=UPI0011A6EE9D|nr:Shedu immune nuclease family protein [Agrobacterium sp. DE0009]
MATFGPQFGNDDKGTLFLQRKGPGLVEVFFTPSDRRIAIADLAEINTTQVLLRFDAAKHTTTLFPINTMPESEDFLMPKYDPIISIEIIEDEGFFQEFNGFRDREDVEAYLAEGMPRGFVKDPNYGLGLDRKLSFILTAIRQVEGVTNLRITDERELDVAVTDGGTTYEIGYKLFDELRRNANRFETKAQGSARRKKLQTAYTNLLTRLDPKKFPVRIFDRAPDDIADVIGNTITDSKLSENDRAAVVNMAAASVRTSLKSQRVGLVKLHDEIELASLDELIARMEERFAERTSELQWQKLLEANPFILDMAFNVPVLLLQGQAHVGGKVLNGSGEKIADFLITNKLTDSIAVLEIKTPGMELIGKREYRGGVYTASAELVGAVAQVLDQIDKLRSNIYRLQSENRPIALETYGIKGTILAGTIPEGPRKRAFELYRASLAGVAVVTFDELLLKLKSLRDLLGGKADIAVSKKPKPAQEFEDLF